MTQPKRKTPDPGRVTASRRSVTVKLPADVVDALDEMAVLRSTPHKGEVTRTDLLELGAYLALFRAREETDVPLGLRAARVRFTVLRVWLSAALARRRR